MKSTRFAGLRPIHPYQPGDILLEADRLMASGPIILKTLSQTQIAAATDKEKDDFLDLLKPKADDYPALKGTLRFLKFSAKDVTELHEGIGSVINMAAGCVTIVGAVITVADLMVSLFGPKKVDETLQYVKHISQRVDQIYGYLAAQSRRGLYNEAVDWRAHIDNVRNAVANARGSRSPLNLQALVNLKGPLDSTLANMA